MKPHDPLPCHWHISGARRLSQSRYRAVLVSLREKSAESAEIATLENIANREIVGSVLSALLDAHAAGSCGVAPRSPLTSERRGRRSSSVRGPGAHRARSNFMRRTPLPQRIWSPPMARQVPNGTQDQTCGTCMYQWHVWDVRTAKDGWWLWPRYI